MVMRWVLSFIGKKLLGLLLTTTVGAALAGTGVWHFQGGKIARMERDHAQRMVEHSAAANARLQAAIAKGDRLYLQLSETNTELRTEYEKATKEIEHLTTGKHCLGAAVVGVLDGTSSDTGLSVPEATSRPAATSAPPATDPHDRYATDTDIAGWIADAKRRHGECRAKLDALIAWHEEGVADHGR
uniref:Bacteriophage Rz lysis protein n=1 Tax=Candidatus Kentrum sp. LFY TaxID=2126342 RepID=A0A450WXN8_9GAMM|nr:MAG: hypothetical protein BECKLFY1418C_GA0070996_110214 [Candidatus Kentron sp. LFY]